MALTSTRRWEAGLCGDLRGRCDAQREPREVRLGGCEIRMVRGTPVAKKVGETEKMRLQSLVVDCACSIFV